MHTPPGTRSAIAGPSHSFIRIGRLFFLSSYLGLLHVLYKVYVDWKTTICSYERRASLREFYGVLYPSLQQLEADLKEMEDSKGKGQFSEICGRTIRENWWKLANKDMERDEECGICMEACTKTVLPNCNHAMCINCYRDWGSLKRVTSRDLWVLTGNSDVVDTVTLAKENMRGFYCYIDKLPLAIPDSLFSVYSDYLA